jgi:hypothetical protein
MQSMSAVSVVYRRAWTRVHGVAALATHQIASPGQAGLGSDGGSVHLGSTSVRSRSNVCEEPVLTTTTKTMARGIGLEDNNRGLADEILHPIRRSRLLLVVVAHKSVNPCSVCLSPVVPRLSIVDSWVVVLRRRASWFGPDRGCIGFLRSCS